MTLAYKAPGVGMTIGSRLRQARVDAGLTQKQVASKCGWESESQSRVSQYENDKREPTLSDIAKFAKATGADPGQLAFGKSDLKPEEAALLQAYRNATEEGRSFIRSACEASRPRGAQGKRKSGD
jgi:transcriptional regulator with XRE-family HTH domain